MRKTLIIVVLVAALESSTAAGRDELPVLQIDTVLIKGATFTMGNPLKTSHYEYHEDEAPIEVTVRDFRIAKYPVTAEQMSEFLNSAAAKAHDPATLYCYRQIAQYPLSAV